MTADQDLTRIVRSWLRTDEHESADRVLASLLDLVDATPQRRPARPVRRIDVNTYLKLAVAAVLVAAVAIVWWRLLPDNTGVGAPATPTPTATPAPTPTPTPTATLVPDSTIPPDGSMKAGSYVTHPLPAPDDGLALRFTVPAGWHGFGDMTMYSGSTAFQFTAVNALNSDLCDWNGAKGEVNVGTTVDDLVTALVAQTKYPVSDPVDVSIGGYSGKRVDVVYPAGLFKDASSGDAPGCDEGVTRLFGDRGIYGQGPNERWQTNILDVNGTRFVIIVQDFPSTSADERAKLDAIIASMEIDS